MVGFITTANRLALIQLFWGIIIITCAQSHFFYSKFWLLIAANYWLHLISTIFVPITSRLFNWSTN